MYFERKVFILYIGIFVGVVAQCQELKEKSLTTSIAGMEELLDMERMLIQSVEKFTTELDTKVKKLKDLVAQLQKESNKSLNNAEEYLQNPLNAYTLIRRMHNDWPNIELFLTKPIGKVHLEVIQKLRPQMPTAVDLKEACDAIYRLQLTYGLDPGDMAAGLLNGEQYDSHLQSIDSYFLGHHLFVEGKQYHSALWTFSSIMTYSDSNYYEIIDFSQVIIYYLYAETLVKQGRPRDALIPIEHAYNLRPKDAELLKRKNDIRHLANISSNEPEPFLVSDPCPYELGCRGHFSTIPSRLFCLYNTTMSPFTLLAPFKMEIISMDPYMVLYHDVITDKEIDALKDLARPKLRRAAVYTEDKPKEAQLVKTRTAKSSGFTDASSNIVRSINARIGIMTGFDVKNAEILQVMNYGMGGHYDTHYDFFNVSETNEVIRDEGDRIATVLFYLSDVEQGGATVFPNIDIAVFPRKGSAIVWYNLLNDLTGDFRTLHAACPVLVGSKWVSNKWIRSKDQMFRKPCYR